MSKTAIIKLHPEDYSKCSNIWNMEKNPDWADEWYKQILEGSREVFIYTMDGEFIGEIALYKNKKDKDYYISGKRIYISRMIVKKEFRNRGIGGSLIDFACNIARDRGYKEISLGVDADNQNALHLYEVKGFTTQLFHGSDKHGEFYKLMKKL